MKHRAVQSWWLLMLVLISILPGCFARKSNTIKHVLHIRSDTPLRPKQKDDDLTITVWIHGTRLFPRPLFKEFFQGKPGLIRAAEISPEYRLRVIADMLSTAAPQVFNPEHFYLFGWSGKLCFKERQQTAELLYEALLKKCKEYYLKYHTRPRIRLICHSHGGNVALNLSNIHHTEDVSIDELIMLACPVQQQTLHCIKDPLFGQIYALYSTLDPLQILDPQGLYKREEKTALFSKRLFPPQSNLAQIKIRLNGRALFHNEFVLEPFLCHLPEVIETIKDWQRTDRDHQRLRRGAVRILSIKTRNSENR